MHVSRGLLLPFYTRLKEMHIENLHYTSVLNNLISWTSNFRWRQIKKFENINDISINIYINEKRIVDTIRRLKKEQTHDSYT